MQCRALWALVALGAASQVTPVQKVISMMEKMAAEGEAAMAAEKALYLDYEAFAEETTVAKGRAISEASEKMEALGAAIEKASSELERLAGEVAEHLAVIDKTSSEKMNATAVRQKEAADFGTTLKDYQDSLLAIGKASKALKSTPVLLEIKETLSPREATKILDDFLTSKDEKSDALLQEPAYESQSSGVLELLEKLEDQFTSERNSLKVEELRKKKAFESLVATLEASTKDAAREKERKLQEKARIAEQKAKDESELEETKSLMEEDVKYKKDLEASWKQKSMDFHATQKLRAEELDAIQKATEIISGSAVAGSAEKHLPALLARGTALAALKGPGLKKVSQLLQAAGRELQSPELVALSQRVKADPIGKVKQMIEGMMSRMEQEAAAETTKFQWCKEEMAQNTETRSAKSDEVEDLQAQIDKMKSSSELLGKEILSLNEQIKESEEAMSKATSLRQKEKKENTLAIKDAKAAQAAVAEALSVLNEFYAKGALLQAPYQGMASGGVIGMIEVIQSDFARLEAETTSAEQQGSKEFASFMEDSKLDVTAKQKDVEHKSARKESEAQQLRALATDLGAVQKELDAAVKTFEQLKPQCADEGASYAERKAKREAEIKSLEQALDALKIAR